MKYDIPDINHGFSVTIVVCIPYKRGSRGGGGQGVRKPHLKKHKNKGFLGNNGPNPLKSQSYQAVHNRHARETPFKWRFAGGAMMARL